MNKNSRKTKTIYNKKLERRRIRKMTNEKKGIKKSALLKLNNIRANNWDIDCDTNFLNDYSDDYGFYEDRINIENKWR